MLSAVRLEAATFDAEKRTSFDWSMYPILRFPDVPDSIEIHIINRPGMPFLGSGEPACLHCSGVETRCGNLPTRRHLFQTPQ